MSTEAYDTNITMYKTEIMFYKRIERKLKRDKDPRRERTYRDIILLFLFYKHFSTSVYRGSVSNSHKQH